MKNEISESIFDNGKIVIPMADVQHIEYVKHPTVGDNGIQIITNKTHWDMEADTWSNPIYINEQDKSAFMKAWCYYRAEFEGLLGSKENAGKQKNK